MGRTPTRYKAETGYAQATGRKANVNNPTMAFVGNGDGATAAVAGRPNFYWVRLVDDDNRLTQARSPIPLGYDDIIYVRKAKERNLTYYEFFEFIENSTGGTTPPLPAHDHSDATLGDQDLRQIQEFEVDDATILTIDVNGTVTRTQVYHIIAANAGAADNLDQIDGGVEGDFLIIQPDAGDTITVRHNAGGAGDNIWFTSGSDIVLDNQDHLFLVYNGTWWCDQSGGAGGLIAHVHDGALTGGPDLNPETITTQMYIVGAGGTFTTLGAAIVAFNADAPAIGVILVAGVTTVEAGAVTIPDACHVFGTEGSIIGMGGNLLTIATGSLSNVTVTSTNNTVLYINNDDPKLRNVRAISSNLAGGVIFNIDGTASPQLFDCVAESTQTNIRAFYLQGSGSPEFYRCRAESSAIGMTGWSVQAACTPLLEHCFAEDVVNISTGLLVGNFAAVVTTRYCTFRATAAGSDVNFGAAGHWIYLNDSFEVANCTISGVAQPDEGQPVIWFDYTATVTGDFGTVQAAIDWFVGKNIAASCKIDVDAGAYAEQLDFSGIFCAATGSLELEGDTRVLAGLSYVSGDAAAAAWAALTIYAAGAVVQPTAPNNFHYKCQVGGTTAAGEPVWPTNIGSTVIDGTVTWICSGVPNNRTGLANGGGTEAACMLANAGNVITVTMTNQGGGAANPDFDADGWVNGDKVLIYNNAGAVAEYTISATLNNAITLTVAAPAVGNLGTAITLVPNRTISAGANTAILVEGVKGILIDGFRASTTGANTNLLCQNDGEVGIVRFLAYGDNTALNYGIVSQQKAQIRGDAPVSVVNCWMGIQSTSLANITLVAGTAVVIKATIYAFDALFFGNIVAGSSLATGCLGGFVGRIAGMFTGGTSYAIDCTIGFESADGGVNYIAGGNVATGAHAEGCTTGFNCVRQSYMQAGYAHAMNNTTGYYASYNSYLYAAATNGRNAGNTTNYSPAASDTEGNVYAIITWS